MKLKNMKLTHIAFAVATLGMATAHAASLPGLTAAGIPANNQIFISGSSSLSASLDRVVRSMCDTTNGGVATTSLCGYANLGTNAGRAVRCTKGKVGSGFSGVPFAVIKRDTDGSFAGVDNVISQIPLTGWCDTTGINTTLPIASNAGLSDINHAIWIGMLNTGALSLPVRSLVGVTSVGGFAGQGFGIMVSDNMYKAMQSVQADKGRLPASCDSDTDNSHDGVFERNNLTPGQCQPSISKEEYAAIVDGTNFNYINSPALTGTTNPINLCRRVETSGTQAASNVYFLHNPCANANPTYGFKPPKRVFPGNGVVVASGGVSGNYEEFPPFFSIFEGSGTGDTRDCISRRDLGQDPDGTVDTDGLGKFAIGVVSLENPLATGRKYIKLDGVSPNAYQVPVSIAVGSLDGDGDGWAQDPTNRITTVEGFYDFAPELEMLWSDNAAVNPANFVTALTKIRSTFADPNAVDLNGVFQANTGSGTHPANPTKVHKGTRNGNFCAPQALAD